MADEQPKVEEAPDAKPARSERAGKLGLILQLVNTIAIVAVLALQVLRPGGARQAPRAAEEKHVAARAPGEAGEKAKPDTSAPGGLPGPTMRLADFVVHLRDPDADRYARVSFEVELRDEKAKEGLSARLPQLRDAFLVYLSDRSSDDLRGGDAISRVKAALTQKLSDVAKEVPVRALYITELVVQ